MSKGKNFIFIFLIVISWIIFVGLCIEAGGLIVNFIFSLVNPDVVDKLYQKLDLSDLYQRNRTAYFSMYSFILVIALLKAYMFYIVIRLVSKLDLSKPFSSFVSRQISLISYYTLAIGVLSYIARQSAKNLSHRGFEMNNIEQFWVDSQAFIIMAAVIYIIAVIFKKGIDIQNETDLTV